MIRRYVSFVVSWPKTIIAIIVAISIGLGFYVTKIQMLLDVDDQIPPR